ncbi:glycoside hydrolase family 26 protein [Mucilaginibacter sp.]|jgi:mannan endo-1,4-beta-mannosidase|uniref:glycoside hydrolase family 26 protein n=1 Tax=Mucilaginibacter sp. TaxID=1882438 RepID=UPI002C5C6D1A|nr:glycosyl hydrolase [Mucilaginibacter sp.]HTI61304.1 glycosyl hydrolase [Mucilaginibacter sp.]
MKNLYLLLFLVALISGTTNTFGQNTAPQLVTAGATPEAKELYAYINSISGRRTMAGQHSVPLLGGARLSEVYRVAHEYPAVFGQDFGFSFPGDWDGINYRQNLVDEAIRRNSEGFIITLMWHAVPPTMDEPVSFKEAIQSQLTDAQWNELVTPGTHLNEKWKSQVDVIAFFLKQLQYAHVPVLWRPYHEMNGGWFWWGKKKGDNGYKKLYKMLYDRLVNFHGLKNLVWVYNTNEFKPGVDRLDEYYPGDDVVDIITTDVYTQGFDQENYDQIIKLAGNKPVALGEVGTIPTPEILQKQPRWTWFMFWGDPGGPSFQTYRSEQVIKLKDLPWVKVKDPRMFYPVIK